MSENSPYDAELGKITEQDREYAKDMLEDLAEPGQHETPESIAAYWLRKVRYEAVIADRKTRGLEQKMRS
jgi:hypothetical protein